MGKGLSLSVEERSSPVSREAQVDADNPASCYTYMPTSVIFNLMYRFVHQKQFPVEYTFLPYFCQF